MNTYSQYLQDRIAQLSKAHANLKNMEKEQENETLSIGCNSMAAALWDTKCELETALSMFEACPVTKAFKLLIDATNELLHIMRNHYDIEHIKDISRILNETKTCIVDAHVQGFLNQK